MQIGTQIGMQIGTQIGMQIGTQIGMQIGTLAQLCVEQVYETGARAGGGGKEAGMAVSSRCLRDEAVSSRCLSLPPALSAFALSTFALSAFAPSKQHRQVLQQSLCCNKAWAATKASCPLCLCSLCLCSNLLPPRESKGKR